MGVRTSGFIYSMADASDRLADLEQNARISMLCMRFKF
jgi:hypothetical protein